MARAFWSAFLIPPPQCAPKSTARKLALSRGFSVRPHRCKARSGEACARLLVWGWPRLWVDLGERLRSRAYSRLAWPMGDGDSPRIGLFDGCPRPHRSLQLALRPPRARRVPAAHREHGHGPGGDGGDTADPELAALARARLGR